MPLSGRQFSQHIVQDAAVHEIFDLVRGIDAAQRVEAELAAVLAGDVYFDILTRFEACDAGYREAVIAGQAE